MLARRLIEAGIRLVTVTSCRPDGDHLWDTHGQNFTSLKNTLLPPLDQAYSALLEDLLERGLLEDTVVYLGGEFGRSPRVGQNLGGGVYPDGRDHYPNCFFGVLAGGRTRAGIVHGVSDARASAPVATRCRWQTSPPRSSPPWGLIPKQLCKHVMAGRCR